MPDSRALAPAPPPPRPEIPDFTLLVLIGQGSYGDVWLARGVTGAFRAVKIVWRARFADLRPYEREFEGITRFAEVSLREPSQLALLHAGRNDAAGFFYYVMELADDAESGRDIAPARYTPLTLKERAAARGGFPAGEVVDIGVALARALGSLHAAGLVHRDIKPSNIIFVGGVPKLADVGLVAAASAQLTFVGTEGFVPPEGPGAPAADVFSLGKVLYELATRLDRNEFPRLPDGLAQRADRREFLELNEVLLRAGEPEARRRYADAGALLDELLLLQAGKSVRRLRAAERRFARAWRGAAVLALVAVIAGTGAYVERQRANEETALRAQAEAERDELARRTVYAATLGNAQNAIRNGAFGHARKTLAGLTPRNGEADLRGFEWHALQSQAVGDPATVLQERGAAIYQLVLSPDQRRLAVHTQGQRAEIRELTPNGRTISVEKVAALGGFSADGEWLLGTNDHGAPQRWRVHDGTAADSGSGATRQRVLGVQPEGRLIGLVAGNPAELRVWDFGAAKETLRLPLGEAVEGLSWEFFRGGVSADGRQVAIAWVRGRGSEAAFRLTWVDLRGEQPAMVHAALPERPSAVGFDEISAWAVQADPALVWRVAAGSWKPSGERWVRDLRRVVDAGAGRHIGCDREQIFWFDARGVVQRIGRGHEGIIGDLAADSTGRVFSGSHGGELRCWVPDSEVAPSADRDRLQIWNSRGGATLVNFTPDSSALLVPWDGGSVRLLDVETLRVIGTLPGLRCPVWSSGEEVLGLAVAGGGYVRANWRGGAAYTGFAGATGPLHLIASRDGARVALTDSAGRLWVEERGRPSPVPLLTGGFENRFAVRGNEALTRAWMSGNDNVLRSYDLDQGRELWREKLPALAPSIGLAPDGRNLIVPLENGSLEVRAADTGRLLRTINVGASTPQDALYSPDGRRVFVAGSKGDITCLETEHWSQLLLLQLPTDEALHRLELSPDGTVLAAVTKTGVLHLVRARPEKKP